MRWVCVPAVLAALLCGCGSPATNTVADPPSTVAVSPSSAVPPSAHSSASPTAAAPVDAIDVHAHDHADFASPDGSIRCSLTGQDATCNFPARMKRTGVPKASRVCPGAPLTVTGVTVSGLAEFFCSRGEDAHPQQKGSAAVWARTAGVPTVKVGREVLVTLPDGRTLVHGKLSCTSSAGAITCGHAQTKASFTISDAGVRLT